MEIRDIGDKVTAPKSSGSTPACLMLQLSLWEKGSCYDFRENVSTFNAGLSLIVLSQIQSLLPTHCKEKGASISFIILCQRFMPTVSDWPLLLNPSLAVLAALNLQVGKSPTGICLHSSSGIAKGCLQILSVLPTKFWVAVKVMNRLWFHSAHARCLPEKLRKLLCHLKGKKFNLLWWEACRNRQFKFSSLNRESFQPPLWVGYSSSASCLLKQLESRRNCFILGLPVPNWNHSGSLITVSLWSLCTDEFPVLQHKELCWWCLSH